MKRIKLLFAMAATATTLSVAAQEINSAYELAPWYGFREATVSYTFDDGCSGQFSKAIPMFNEFGYHLTLFTVNNWSTDNWTKLQEASKQGHEVASHTVSHADLTASSLEVQDAEMTNSRKDIDEKITDTKCITIAYPMCRPADYSLVKKNFIAARGCQGYIEGQTPKDIYNISSLICGNTGSITTAASLNEKIDNAISTKGWCVFLFHGVDNDGGYSPFSSTEMHSNLEYVQTIDSKIWIATFREACLYILERNNASLKEISANNDKITLSVTDTLDNETYNFPLSFRRSIPKGWKNAKVSQNGKSVEYEIVKIDGKKKIEFNVVPDGGDIEIVRIAKAKSEKE